MKTLLTTLLTLLWVNAAYACAITAQPVKVKVKDKASFSFTAPEKCSRMLLGTVGDIKFDFGNRSFVGKVIKRNQEISTSGLVSKYGECINSHLSKIIGTPIDGKVEFFPSSGYVGMNIKIGGAIDNVVSIYDDDDDNPFGWMASPTDNYKFIDAYKFLGWRMGMGVEFTRCPSDSSLRAAQEAAQDPAFSLEDEALFEALKFDF